MSYAAYDIRRTWGFIWRWEVRVDGEVVKTGFSFSRAAARWSARQIIRLVGREARRPAPEARGETRAEPCREVRGDRTGGHPV